MKEELKELKLRIIELLELSDYIAKKSMDDVWKPKEKTMGFYHCAKIELIRAFNKLSEKQPIRVRRRKK